MVNFPLQNIYTPVNVQPVPAIYNEGFSQYENVAKAMQLANDNINAINQLNTDKLGKTGDFQGTWNGLSMHQSDLGLASDWNSAKGTFSTVSERLNNMGNIDGGTFGSYLDPITGDIDGGVY